MAEKEPQPQSPATRAQIGNSPRFRTDIYPFIEPSKFRATQKDKVVIITGKLHTPHSLLDLLATPAYPYLP